MRGFHKLRTNPKLTYPKNLIFVDTETTTIKDDEDIHVPSLIVGVAEYIILDQDLEVLEIDKIVFTDRHVFWRWLDSITSVTKEVTAYAHNWSFDYPVLRGLEEVPKLGYRLNAIVDNSPPIILRYSRTGSKLNIIDSLNYFQQRLADMGEVIGYPKLDIDFDNTDKEYLVTYCERDVEILRKSVISLIQYLYKNNLTRMTHTVSSLAFSAYIRNFMPHQIYIDGDELRVAFTRKSYFGGRTECFRIGKFTGKFYLIDVNSMYPFLMRNNDFPCKTIARYKNIDVADIEDLMLRYCITVHCRIKTDIPCFPLKIGGRTCFPVGSYTTYLSTPEVSYALENDLITDVFEVAIHQKAGLFQDYVDFFYTQRLRHKAEGNAVWSELDKKMMNTLYGKFGQQLNEWIETTEKPRGYPGKWTEFDAETMKRMEFMEIDNVVFEASHEEESRDSYPAIAAHVTAYARMLMQYMIDHVGRENVYYGDTDSLLLNETAFKQIESSLDDKILGCWALEGEYTEIDIRGPKDYRFGTKEKIKGCRQYPVRDAEGNLVFTDNDNKKVKTSYKITKEGLYRMTQFSNLRGLIRSGHIHAPILKNVNKELKRVYLKGTVGPDGVVSPLVVDTSGV